MQRQQKNLWLESAFIVAVMAGLVNYIISQNTEISHQRDQIVHCGELRADDIKGMLENSNRELNENLKKEKSVNMLRMDSLAHSTDSLTKHLNHIIKHNGYEIN